MGILVHSVYCTKEDVDELKQLAAEGDVNAQIDLAALEIEDAHDVEQNLAFLIEQGEKGSTLALMDLSFIHREDITRTEADGTETVLIAWDDDKADEFARKAAELGSAWAMANLGVNAWLKSLALEEEEDSAKTAQKLFDAEKWLLAALEAAQKPGSDLRADGVILTMQKLSDIYGDAKANNPIHNEQKAKEWAERADAESRKLYGDSYNEEAHERVEEAKARIAAKKAEYAAKHPESEYTHEEWLAEEAHKRVEAAKARIAAKKAEYAAKHPESKDIHVTFPGPESPTLDWWQPPRNEAEAKQQKERLAEEKRLRRLRHPRRDMGLSDYIEEQQDGAR